MHSNHTISMTRRGFIRLISFLTAAAITFAVMSLVYYRQNVMAKRHIEYGYLRSLEHLALSIDNIKSTLNKGLYSNAPQMMNDIAGKLSQEADRAKLSLSELPVTELNLENTNKFLSQVGNYAHSLARRFADGEELTREDRQNLSTLLNYADSLSGEFWEIESMVSGGRLTFEKVVGNTEHINSGYSPAHISDGFGNIENYFAEYPQLIYDGPYSDHIMSQSPKMLTGATTVSQEEARETAVRVSGLQNLRFESEQGGHIPCYTFREGSNSVAITKDGGHFAAMLKYRAIGEKTITTEQAIETAREYLKNNGFDSLTNTYYELGGGVCLVTFAGYSDGVTIYTDMVKVGVAIDNGEIMSVDARKYLTAHHDRQLAGTRLGLTEEQAAQRVSPHLTIQNAKLAIVPSLGENERLCYEFLCRSEFGDSVLVYINADTGAEEQIMLLRINDSGTLVV